MPRRLIFKEGNNLSSIGPIQSGYKMVAYEGGTFSQKVGGTVSSIGGYNLPYKVYTALLTQSGTASPVATVLENTLEQTPFWEYDEEGYYKFSNISFDSNKLFIVHSFENTNGTSLLNAYAYYDDSFNIFWVETGRLIVSGSNVVMSYQDNIINPSILGGTQLYLEIRVYN